MKLLSILLYCNIFGKLELNSNWVNKIYLLEIKKYHDFFNGSSSLVIDSIDIRKDGTFNKQINLKRNCIYRLNVIKTEDDGNGAAIYRGLNDNFIFICNTKSIKIESSIDDFQTSLHKTNNKYSEFFRKYRKKSTEYLYHSFPKCEDDICIQKSKDSLFKLYLEEDKVIMSQFSTKNDYLYNIFLLKNIEETSLDKYESYFIKQSKSFKTIDSGKFITSFNKFVKKNFGIKNQLFKDFKINDSITLYSLKNGKLKLLNFWASWCSPCIKEIESTLKILYQNDSDKIDIIGFSMDKKYAEYISKSNKLKIPWLNECFQCNNENKDFILSHGITALPRNILLDSTFKIINYDMGEYDIKRLFK